jgi:hypothetical protein
VIENDASAAPLCNLYIATRVKMVSPECNTLKPSTWNQHDDLAALFGIVMGTFGFHFCYL